MASIKCKTCNLVNFSTAVNCKRCGNLLNEFTSFTEQRTYQTNIEPVNQMPQYQTNFEQSNQTQPLYQEQNPFQTQPLYQAQNPYQNSPPAPHQPYPSYQNPPPPNYYNNQYQPQQYQPQQYANCTCIKCGSRNNVSIQNFKKEYVPPLAYLSLLLGILIGLLIILCIKVRHRVNAPFCAECYSKFKMVGFVEGLCSVVFLVGFIAALFIGVVTKSLFIFTVFMLLIVGVVVYGISYSRKYNLKFKRINSREVVVTDPLNGDVYLCS